MNWNDYTINPKVILGYYLSAPELGEVDLHALSFLRDGPVAEIVLDVAQFPEKPSHRWPSEANTCQITLRAIGLSEVEVSSWSSNSSGAMTIESQNNAIRISFAGQSRFVLCCSHLYVAGVSGYVNEKGEQ